METTVRTDQTGWAEALSGVSWASILAGAFVAAAVSLALLALGAGLGLASVSPWSGSLPSGSTFTNITGAYLLLIAVMSSAIGGYLASRLRTQWTNLHTNEVFFRDSAHGFVTWAFATVLSASLLATATANLLGTASGVAAGAGASAAAGRATNPNAVFVDKLFRNDRAAQSTAGSPAATPPAVPGSAPSTTDMPAGAAPAVSNPGANNAAMSEIGRLWTASFTNGTGLQPADRNYVAHLVAQQTGMNEADAQKRVDDVVNETKESLDRARKNAMKLAFWMTAALLFGAFASSLAAVEGGQHRDGTWNDHRLVPRAW